MLIRDALNQARKDLYEHQKNEHAAVELLTFVMEMETYQLFNSLDEEITTSQQERYQQVLNEYLNNKPLQHIIGYEVFLGREFSVNEKVLIPRYETEELVENILYSIDDYFNDYEEILVGDVGCGSLAIALSIDLEEPRTNVYASDISEDALEIAQLNNDKLGGNVTLLQGDLLQPFKGMKFDILVSNPPYIPKEEILDKSVKEFEPGMALFGGDDGLYFYRQILKEAPNYIKDKAIVAFEIGHDQADALVKEARKYFIKDDIEVLKDINGKNRMLFIYHNIR